MKTWIQRFWREEDGASAIEYGLLAALIAVVIAGSVKAVGTTLNGVFSSVNTAL